MRRTIVALLAWGLLAVPTTGESAAAKGRRAPTCTTAAKPLKLSFARKLGATTATLRWTTPRAKRRAVQRWRVTRGREVIGQTKKRAMRVRISLDRSYRFVVTSLDRRGKPTRCRAVKRVKVSYRAPGAPRFPAVSGDESGLRLTWQAGKRGDGRPAGYRLLRDGRVVGQTRATSWSLPVEPNRTYAFAIVAVDARGRTSAPSRTVRASTDHAPPTAPPGMQALPVSDTAIGASWQPSSVRSGSIVAYRLMRDGAVVRQLPATSTVVDNLAPSTAYELSVVAIDSLGYVSAPASASARTHDPVQTSGFAHAYLLASTDQSFADFRAHYRQIGVVHPTYFDCTGRAELVGADDPLITRWATARGVEVLPRVNCQRTRVLNKILTDPPTRAAWLDRVVSLAAEHDYDGVSIDFEAGAASDRAALTSFVQELSARLHAVGRKVAIAVSPKTRDSLTHPRSGIFDYPALAEHADYLFAMSWGLHWSTSRPGPQDDVTWVRQVAAYVASLPQRHKFILGTNLYALDWPVGGDPPLANAYEYQDIVPLLPSFGAQIRLDPATDNWQALYTDAAGVQREVWYPDAETTARRLRIAREAGFGGVGFWRLGREDQRVWDDPLLAPGVPW